jgi:hypothetical protein
MVVSGGREEPQSDAIDNVKNVLVAGSAGEALAIRPTVQELAWSGCKKRLEVTDQRAGTRRRELLTSTMSNGL